MIEPLSRSFNVAVMQCANRVLPQGYDVSPRAPSTLEELIEHIETTGRICVWSGASDATIFADPGVNYAFRAWHDYHHYHLRVPFTYAGEVRVFAAQCRDLIAVYGPSQTTQNFISILACEVLAQFEYNETYGHFPVNQMAFTRGWLAGKGITL